MSEAIPSGRKGTRWGVASGVSSGEPGSDKSLQSSLAFLFLCLPREKPRREDSEVSEAHGSGTGVARPGPSVQVSSPPFLATEE